MSQTLNVAIACTWILLVAVLLVLKMQVAALKSHAAILGQYASEHRKASGDFLHSSAIYYAALLYDQSRDNKGPVPSYRELALMEAKYDQPA